MIKNARITIFILITFILMYIGSIGLILSNDGHDLTSVFLVTMIFFIVIGCMYKAIFECKKDITNISK